MQFMKNQLNVCVCVCVCVCVYVKNKSDVTPVVIINIFKSKLSFNYTFILSKSNWL